MAADDAQGRSRESAPRPSVALKFLNRWPLRRLAGPVSRLRRWWLRRPLRPLVATADDLTLIDDGEDVRLARLQGGLTRRRARQLNLRLAADLLESAGVEYFAVPDEQRRHALLAVESESWERFVSAVAVSGELGLHVVIETEDVAGAVQRSVFPASSDVAGRAMARQDAIDLFEFRVASDSGLRFGRGDACRIERWHRTESGTLEAPSRNQRAAAIDSDRLTPTTVEVYGEQWPSVEPLTRRHVFEFNEPIDAVYLWVDGQDEAWLRRRQEVTEELTGVVTKDSIDPSRFRDNGELRYSLRSVLRHCDWIRNIILVTDSQVPAWLDTSHPRIRMVDHQELFGDSGALPTFNSHAITSRLHHIEGLSEQYLIFNDDVFVGHDVGPSTFFLSNGQTRFFLSRSTLPQQTSYGTAHEAARQNTIELIERDFGVTVTRNFFHTPVPQSKSLLFDLEQRYPHAFHGNWSHQLRSPEDVQINSWMHHYMGYLLRKTLPSSIPYDYFSLDEKNFRSRLENLLASRRSAAFCINDSSSALQQNIDFLPGWLQRYFPIAAPWEKNT